MLVKRLTRLAVQHHTTVLQPFSSPSQLLLQLYIAIPFLAYTWLATCSLQRTSREAEYETGSVGKLLDTCSHAGMWLLQAR